MREINPKDDTFSFPKKALGYLFFLWIINSFVLLMLPYLLSSVTVGSIWSAMAAAALLGLINTFIRPLLVLFTLPISVFTLGFFVLVVNALLFMLVAKILPSFSVENFWSAFWGSIIYSIFSWALATLLLPQQKQGKDNSYPNL